MTLTWWGLPSPYPHLPALPGPVGDLGVLQVLVQSKPFSSAGFQCRVGPSGKMQVAGQELKGNTPGAHRDLGWQPVLPFNFSLVYSGIRTYSFPVAAVTNAHKLAGLEQQNCMLSVLGARSLKSRVRRAPLQRLQGRMAPRLFQHRCLPAFLVCGRVTPQPLQGQHPHVTLLHLHITIGLPPSHKDTCECVQGHPDKPRERPISGSSM